ncbi:MAG: transposase [Pandoraea pnomenusa]|nr:transposase [Pandoraea pnomenusa]
MESFNSRFRKECLSCTNLPHVKVVTEAWRREYNEAVTKWGRRAD